MGIENKKILVPRGIEGVKSNQIKYVNVLKRRDCIGDNMEMVVRGPLSADSINTTVGSGSIRSRNDGNICVLIYRSINMPPDKSINKWRFFNMSSLEFGVMKHEHGYLPRINLQRKSYRKKDG